MRDTTCEVSNVEVPKLPLKPLQRALNALPLDRDKDAQDKLTKTKLFIEVLALLI